MYNVLPGKLKVIVLIILVNSGGTDSHAHKRVLPGRFDAHIVKCDIAPKLDCNEMEVSISLNWI